MEARSIPRFQKHSPTGFTLIELLVVIAIIAILAVVVVLTLNPAQLLAQSRDANRVSDMATLQSALNLYVTDQAGASTFSLGNASDTYPSIADPAATSTNACPSLGLPSFTSGSWLCSSSSSYRTISSSGWIPVNLSSISAGSPISDLPVDPTNQTSSGLYYAYNTNGSQFQVTADLESSKYKAQYGSTPATNLFPEVISGGTQGLSALYNPSGLVGYWPMNEGSGSSTIDQSGNGDNGTWSGTPIGTNGTYYAGGKVGAYAGDFDGSSTNVNASDANFSAGTNPYTMSAWVNTSYIGGGDVLCYGAQAVSEQPTMSVNDISGVDYFQAADDGYSLTGTMALTLNTWYMLTVAYNGTNYALYVNGISVGSGTMTTNTVLGGHFRIGYRAIGSGSYYSGLIDDARVYNRALSPAEVMALYDAEK